MCPELWRSQGVGLPVATELNSAGQSPTLLVYKTVHESLPFTRLLNSLVIVIHASRGFGHDNVCAAAPDSPVYDSLDSCPHGGPPFGHLGRNTVRSEEVYGLS